MDNQAFLERLSPRLRRRVTSPRREEASDDRVDFVGYPLPDTDSSPLEPTIHKTRRALLAWDGRLDNQDEIRRALSLPSRASSAALVTALYEQRGLEFAADLVGDWATAIWDRALDRMVLARDPFGARPLYYALTDRQVLWSSELLPLAEASGASGDLDDEWIAGYLCRSGPSERTPYSGIRAVEPGNLLVVERDRVSRHRFWHPGRIPELPRRLDEEFEEELSDLLSEAISCRLQAPGAACAELSGGLDSSSIVCLGDRLIQEGRSSTTTLATISYVFDSARSSDERRFIQLVEGGRKQDGYHLNEDDHPLFVDLIEGSRFDYPSPIHAFAGRYRALDRIMEDLGTRVLLRGTGGDDVLWGEAGAPIELADDLRSGRLASLFHHLHEWGRASPAPYSRLLWRGAALPLLPRTVRARSSGAAPPLPDWIDPAFAKRYDLRERMLGPQPLPAPLPSRRKQVSMILDVARYASWAYRLGDRRIAATYPFLHKPLVEFCLALPLRQMLRPGDTRSILRRALSEILPREIASRRTKGGPDEAIYRGIAGQWPSIRSAFEAPLVAERGYVDRERIQQGLIKARHGQKGHSVFLLSIIALEFWLRSREISPSLESVGDRGFGQRFIA